MRTRGLVLALLLAGCSAAPTYRDYASEPAPALSSVQRSPEAAALVQRFYGAENTGDMTDVIAQALSRSPRDPDLHEIAGYQALLRADGHGAFVHFVTAAADAGAVAPEIYLWEAGELATTATEHRTFTRLLEELSKRHPNPTVRQRALYLLARERRFVGELAEAQQASSPLGFVPEWLVAGAFDNDQGKGAAIEYEPERDPDPAKTYPGLLVPVRWRKVATSVVDRSLPLGDVVWPVEASVAYAQTFVESPSARDVFLALTTTNAVKVWVNGTLVASEEQIQDDEFDNVVARASLRAGTNRVLVKSSHRRGGFHLAARMLETNGAPADVRYSTEPRGLVATSSQGKEVATWAGVQALADRHRKRFLLGRTSARRGRTKQVSWTLEPLVRELPKNPVVMFFAALGFFDNDQAGRALDLVNAGVKSHPTMAGFSLVRGRFHAKKRLLEKATNDFRAVLAQYPRSATAAYELAAVYGWRGFAVDRCQALEGMLATWPDHLGARIEHGRCLEERGYVTEAEAEFEKARAIAPGSHGALAHLVKIAKKRADYRAALERSRALRAVFPTYADYQLEQADLERLAGQRGDARKTLEALVAQSPDSPRAYDRLAHLALEEHRTGDAVGLFRLALERDPENAGLAERIDFLSPTTPSLADRLAATADDIERAIKSADRVIVDPGSHMVVLLDDEVVSVNPDGSAKRIVTEVLQAVNTQGRDQLIQARLSGRGRLKVLEAYSVKKNGERQEASSVTGGTIRFRSLDVGSIVVRQYVNYAPPAHFLPNEFTSTWRFSRLNAQVEHARYRLVLGENRPLHVFSRGIARKDEKVEGARVVTFEGKGLAPVVPEPNMPALQDVHAIVALSTVADWEAYAKWERALLADAFGPSQELDGLAKKLTAGASTPREKVDRLAQHVAEQIRYQQEYEDTIAGVKPHAASIVHERGYGDCKDKAVLLIRLARAVGIDVRFAILRTTPYGSVLKDVPNQQFNHAIAYVPKQAGIDEAFFVDTTTNGLDLANLRSDDQGALSLVLDTVTGKSEFVEIPYQPPAYESFRESVRLDLGNFAGSDGASPKVKAVAEVELRGQVAQGARITLRNKQHAKNAYQGLSETIFPGTTLLQGSTEHDQDLTRPLRLTLVVDATNAVQAQDENARLSVPLAFPLNGQVTLATRQLPLVLSRGVRSFELAFDLPEGARVAHLPSDFTVEHPCFKVSRSSRTSGKKVTIASSYSNSCARVEPRDYPAFRAAVQKVVAQANDPLVFGPLPRAKR